MKRQWSSIRNRKVWMVYWEKQDSWMQLVGWDLFSLGTELEVLFLGYLHLFLVKHQHLCTSGLNLVGAYCCLFWFKILNPKFQNQLLKMSLSILKLFTPDTICCETYGVLWMVLRLILKRLPMVELKTIFIMAGHMVIMSTVYFCSLRMDWFVEASLMLQACIMILQLLIMVCTS